MNNPEYLAVGDKKYKINTDYRVVLEYNRLVKDTTISEYERVLSAICLFYGEEGINNQEDYESLLKGIQTFVKGRPSSVHHDNNKEVKIDMDYDKDWGLIVASFWQTYGTNINDEKMHWWMFYDLLNGLPSDCILNSVREIRNRDLSKINDKELKNKYAELKRTWKLDVEDVQITDEQKKNADKFFELAGIDRK